MSYSAKVTAPPASKQPSGEATPTLGSHWTAAKPHNQVQISLIGPKRSQRSQIVAQVWDLLRLFPIPVGTCSYCSTYSVKDSLSPLTPPLSSLSVSLSPNVSVLELELEAPSPSSVLSPLVNHSPLPTSPLSTPLHSTLATTSTSPLT